MTTLADYRAALAQMLKAAEFYTGWDSDEMDEAMHRARSLLAAPEEVGVADEELETLIPWLLEQAIRAANSDAPIAAGKLTLAAQLLGERLDGPAHPAPVPVGERLPGVGDLCPLGMCWWYDHADGAWVNCDRTYGAHRGWRHWLPHWALPLPGAQP